MNYFVLFILICLLEKALLDYEKIELIYYNSIYNLEMNFPKSKHYFPLSTFLPMSFFPSSNCSVCSESLIEKKNDTNMTNLTIPFYFYNISGNLLKGNFSTDKYTSLEENFLAFDNITYLENYTGNGTFSLSYLNYNFNTSKKIFAIKFNLDNAELHLGGYDDKGNTSDFKNFTVVVENVTETEEIKNETLNNIFENSFLEEESNKTEGNITYNHSIWYINFTNIKINKEEKEQDVNKALTNYKLTLDMSSNSFYVPKEFFVKNVDKIFPKEGKCQMARNGYYGCMCDEDYKTKFGSFKFISNDGQVFWINATDYITHQSLIQGSQCQVYLRINYENDLFIGGIPVMNNYYNIFDVENKTFMIYKKDDNYDKQIGKYILLFFISLILSSVVLFGGYYLYNKHIIRNPTGLLRNNNNNNNENDNHLRDL
jgi:hypothetical protein